MPELPEVETVVRTLRPRLAGSRISAVALHRADILDPPGTDLAAHLIGRRIASIDRRGKKIVFTLDDANRFYIHLGMTGRLTIEAPDAPLQPHTHLIIQIGDAGLNVRFRDPRRFGGVWWLGTSVTHDADMGPEPLKLRPAQLARRLARTNRAVKTALLDQTVIAGLGNIYADEALFSARLHPQRPANTLLPAEITRLNRAIKTVLNRAINHRGSTLRDYRDANGDAGAFQKLHRVYDRAGQPCHRCGAPITRIVLGGRSTHYCAKCQPTSVAAR